MVKQNNMLKSWPVAILVVSISYAVVAKVGFLSTSLQGNFSPIFPAAGVALAAVLILGRSALFGVWLGSVVINTTSLFDGKMPSLHAVLAGLPITFIIGIGAMSSAAAGAFLVRRFCNDQFPLYSGRNVLVFVAVGALGCCMISPTVGVLTLSLKGIIPWSLFGYSWLTWWLGDAAGVIVAAPLILAWHQPHAFPRNSWWSALEATVLGGMTLLFCFFVFFKNIPFQFGLIPLLFWATLRFAERGASTAAVIITVFATIGTIHGSGPFVRDTVNESLLLLQAFIGVTIIPSLFLAGVLAERKKTEEALRAEKQFTDALLESLPGILYVFGDDGRFIQWNRTYERVIGWSGAEIADGMVNAFDTISLKDRDRVGRLIQDIFETGQMNMTHMDILTRVGAEIPYYFTCVRIYINGKPVLVGIGIDLTENKKAEKALSESEKKFRTLFENSMDMISLTTPDGKIIDVNPAGVNLSGYPSKEALLSLSIQDIYANPNDRARFLELMNKNGFVADFETILLHHDGQKKQVSINASAVRDELGKVTALQGIIRDITEHRKLEDQLRHSQKMEAIGLLAGGIAHDFNNILTVFLTYGSMLRDKLKNDAVLKSYAEQIIESTDRAVDLTRGLLAFSRKQTLMLKPIDLNEAVRNTMKFLQRIIGEDVEVKARLADSKLMVTADSGQIGQVLMNIATNSRDAMPHGGLLSIQTETMLLGDTDVKTGEVEKAGPYACISIADTGQGMDKTTMDRIFEPFFTTKAVGKGTGLGLAIVYGIIKQHCGTIRVYSEPGTGTVFKIYLPLASSATAKPEDDALPVLRGKHETILLVEDNAAVRATIKIVLEDGGYNVIEAVDGDDAIAEFNRHRDEIALLLTDVIMPKKNGKDLYDMIRGIRPEIKALFISGYTADIITSKGLMDEGLHLMNKPLAPDPLKRRIREILDSGRGYPEYNP